MPNIYLILSCIYILLFDFQNLFLKKYLGNIGAAGLTLILPILFILVSYFLKRIKLKEFDKQLILYLWYMIFISFCNTLLLGIKYNIWIYYDENLFIKSLKLISYNIIGFFSIIVFSRILSKNSKNDTAKILNLNYLLLIMYYIYEKTYNVGRIKLTTSEPSEAGYILVIFTLLGLYYNEKIRIKILYIIFFSVLSREIASKGLMIILFISIILIFATCMSKRKIFSTIAILGLCTLIFNIFYFEVLKNSLIMDLKYFTSIVTRSISILTAIKVFIGNILGVSGNYLYYFSNEGYKIYEGLRRIYPNLNYSEIQNLLKTGQNLAPKSGFFMDLILYGIYSIYFYCWTLKYFFSNLKKDLILLILLIFTYMSMLTYIDKYMTPTYILVFSIFQSIIIKRRRKHGCINYND